MFRFEIGGYRIASDKIGDAMMAAVLNSMETDIREKVGTMHDPETGAFPTVVVRGNSLDDLKTSVEGSLELIALVKQRLGIDEEDEGQDVEDTATMPCVFLLHLLR
jgi:hypothetical protein